MRRSTSRSRSPRRNRRRQSDPESDPFRHRNRDRSDREFDGRRRRFERDSGRRDASVEPAPGERHRERSLDVDSGEEQGGGGRRREWQNERRRDSWRGGRAEEEERANWIPRGRRGRIGAWRVAREERMEGIDPRMRSRPIETRGYLEGEEPSGYRPRSEIRSRADAKEKHRRSTEDDEDEGRTLNLNPTDVPKADSYFLHDDRAISRRGSFSSRRPRFYSDSTPHKWGHDMFNRLYGDEKTPPPDEDDLILDTRTRSVVNRVGCEFERSERDRQRLEQHDRSNFDPNLKRWGHDKYHQLYGDGVRPRPDRRAMAREDWTRSGVGRLELSPRRGSDRFEL